MVPGGCMALGVCMVLGGDVHGPGGGCMVEGGCMVWGCAWSWGVHGPGGWKPPVTATVGAVRILLECVLVLIRHQLWRLRKGHYRLFCANLQLKESFSNKSLECLKRF